MSHPYTYPQWEARAYLSAHGQEAVPCAECGKLAWWHLQTRGIRGDNGHKFLPQKLSENSQDLHRDNPKRPKAVRCDNCGLLTGTTTVIL